MSDSVLENPRVALGIAGVVMAVALVASVAYRELSSREEATGEGEVAQIEKDSLQGPAQAKASASNTSFSQSPSADTGWGGSDGFDENWGSATDAFDEAAGPSNRSTGGSGSESRGFAAQAPTGNQGQSRATSGPKITTRSAPSAPSVRSPNGGSAPELKEVGG